MTAQVSMGAHHGNFLQRFMDGMMNVDSHGHATIHSGHFMVSCVHEDLDDADGLQATVKEEEEVRPDAGYNFENARRELSDSYQFGVRSTNQLSIDASLATLFEHMTLAYSGKITSPKWKNFKGIKVKLKDKIRLNNIIWREWHMQYIKRQQPIICQFEAPISERTHSKPEAVVLEGKYWKRRLECLTTEYKKWRLFFKNRFSRVRKDSDLMEEVLPNSEHRKYNRLGTQFTSAKIFNEQMTVEDVEDDLTTFSNDTLFSSLNTPFAFPDAREISQLGFGDIIQPNLIQLQPSLDESMDTLAPLPVLSEFRDFGRSTCERNGSRKISDASLIDFCFGDADFSFDALQRQQDEEVQRISDQMMITTSSDEYHIDQLKQQLMGAIALPLDTSLSDLFVANDNSKLLTDTSDVVMTNAARGGSFFCLDVANERPVIQRELQRRASDQLFQQPPSSYVSLEPDVLCGLNGQPLLSNAQSEFVQCTTGVSFFPGNLNPALYHLIPGGQPVQAVTVIPDGTPLPGKTSATSQISWFLASSPSPGSRVSATMVHSGIEQSRTTQQVQANTATTLLCHESQVNPSACRRGSTGSLQPGKAKKHVTFLCPQAHPASASSKTKPRPLAPAPVHVPAFCDANSKTKSGSLMDTLRPAPSADREQQGSTILAQLLTQGKVSSGPFPKVTGGGSLSASIPSSPGTAKTMLSAVNVSRPAYCSVPLVTPVASRTISIPPQQNQLSKPPSFSEFHKNLLSAAISQTLGVEKQAAQEVTTSLFNNMFSSASLSPITSSSLPSTSPNPCMSRERNPSNESTTSLTDEAARPSGDQRENRRVHHLSAEQKRRSNIKYGFEHLNQMVPELNVMSSGKINKATTLQKAAECCLRMKQERQVVKSEIESLRHQIDDLQSEISSCQAKLPATGVPVVRPQTNHCRVLFEDYVRTRTLANWKFWIFSFLIRPLFEAYDEGVVTTSAEAFCQSVLTWLQQRCSLVALRPAVLKALRELSTTTSILVDPSSMPQEATEAVCHSRHSSGHTGFT